MVDEQDQDQRVRETCNPFLLVGGEPPERPHALYAVLDQASLVGLDGKRGLQRLVFSATDAERFDRTWLEFQEPISGGSFADFYRALPIFLLEVELSPDGVRKLLPAGAGTFDSSDQSAPEKDFTPDDVADGLVDLERRWKKIVLAEGAQPGAVAELYANLFGEAISVAVARVEDVSAERSDQLDKTDPLAGRGEAEEKDIEAVLAGVGQIDHIVVLDVGQGGANGLVSGHTIVAYFDFGGGVTSHKATFPPSLSKFCFCAPDVPIILSHWDHDHWSSEGRDTRAHYKTWIAPKQSGTWSKKKAAFHNSALITSITTHGKLLLWPSSLSSLSVGQITIWKGLGSSRNASGLALTIAPPNDDIALSPVLLPADAVYTDLPNSAMPKNYDAIGCPHHGGPVAQTTIPAATSATYRRLIYSYGHNNSYGHALQQTRQDHDGRGWLDSKAVPANTPSMVRQTEDRAVSGLGHIGFDWGQGLSAGSQGCGGGCTVGVEQV